MNAWSRSTRRKWQRAGWRAGAGQELGAAESETAGVYWVEPGVPVRNTEDGTLGIVWAGPITRPILAGYDGLKPTAVVKLELANGAISGWLETTWLERATQREIDALGAATRRHEEERGVADVVFDAMKTAPKMKNPVGGKQTIDKAWVKLGAAARRSHARRNAVGVVCAEPDASGDVKLLLQNGDISGWVNVTLLQHENADAMRAGWLRNAAALLSSIRASGEWVGAPVRRKQNGALGILTQAPDREGDITLIYEDGSRSGYMKLTALEVPRQQQLRVAEQKGWLKKVQSTLFKPAHNV